MAKEIELYVDTINDFVYDDYVVMCENQGRKVYPQNSIDYKNWNGDMKNLVFRLFIERIKASTKIHNEVEIKSRGYHDKMSLYDFIMSVISKNNKIRFVRETEPDRLSLFVIDKDKHQKTYKITFTDNTISYDLIL